MFPFLLFFIFRDEALIPVKIGMHDIPQELKEQKAVNPNIKYARGIEDADADDEDSESDSERRKNLNLAEIINPYVDRWGAIVGSTVMTVTLVTLLVLNAVSTKIGGQPVYYVTLPAAFLMFCWDLATGWRERKETREIYRQGRLKIEEERRRREATEQDGPMMMSGAALTTVSGADVQTGNRDSTTASDTEDQKPGFGLQVVDTPTSELAPNGDEDREDRGPVDSSVAANGTDGLVHRPNVNGISEKAPAVDVEEQAPSGKLSRQSKEPTTLISLCRDGYTWCQVTFPTVTTVIAHLPFALIPFAFAMFILVQALVTKGWVPVFAHGWDHWVVKTGTMGAIGGMGLLSVLLCNVSDDPPPPPHDGREGACQTNLASQFAGTNIGTTILLSRIIQAWSEIRRQKHDPIGDRTYWATIYSMALGVNYGAFSTAFSASLAGLLWRDILARKHIHVKRLEFARVNVPIIAIAMTVGCAALVGEVYIFRSDDVPHY